MGYIINISRTLVITYSRQGYSAQFIATGATMNMFTGNKNKTLKWVSITPPANITLRIGTTPGGDEVLQDTDLEMNVAQVLDIGYHFPADAQLFFSGTVAGTIIDIFCF